MDNHIPHQHYPICKPNVDGTVAMWPVDTSPPGGWMVGTVRHAALMPNLGAALSLVWDLGGRNA